MNLDRLPQASILATGIWPLVGVLALGWDLGLVMVLFWFDNVAVGILLGIGLFAIVG